MMDVCDYERAIVLAQRKRVRLQHDGSDCGPTPWDSALQAAYGKRRLMIHEEFVLDDVLGKYRDKAVGSRGGTRYGVD